MTDKVTFVCFKWFDPRGRYNSFLKYSAEHVNRLKMQLATTVKTPHELVCVTDDERGVKARCIELDHNLLSKAGHRYPKLMFYRPDAAELFKGKRLVLTDLDAVYVKSIDHILTRKQDFIVWQDPAYGIPGVSKYNTSFVLMDAGARPRIWNEFDPAREKKFAAQRNFCGTDQEWVARCLGPNEAVVTYEDGLVQYRKIRRKDELPEEVRVVFFPGRADPSLKMMQTESPWIKKYWERR